MFLNDVNPNFNPDGNHLPKRLSSSKLCIKYSVSVQKGERVLIWGSEEALPLIRELYQEVIIAGGHPLFKIEYSGFDYIFFREAQEHQLNHQDLFFSNCIDNIDVIIRIFDGKMDKDLLRIDFNKIIKYKLAQIELWKRILQKIQNKRLKWTIIVFPTKTMSKKAGIGYNKLKNIVGRCCLLHTDNPIAEWHNTSIQQQKYCDYLKNFDMLHIIGKDTDLIMSIKGRYWINGDGRSNMPDMEIFSSPIENSINGVITFNLSHNYLNAEIEDIVLKYRKGRIFEASARKGQNILKKILKIPGCKRCGEIGFGLNPFINRILKTPCLDEKINGTIHLALGLSPPFTGGKNSSTAHYDFISDLRKEGEIYADDNLIYKNGSFLI